MGMVRLDGVDLDYEERGSGPPILLIHGTAARLWGPALDGLCACGRVVAYDRRSFGASGHPPLADLGRHRDDAAALLCALDLAPAVVVGWSVGGVVALDLALEHPDLVRALVLIEPPLHAKRRPTLRMARAVVGAQLLGRLGRSEAGATMFLRWALGRRGDATDLDRVSPQWRDAMLANARAIVTELGAGTGEHLDRDRLAAIRAPVTLLVGTESDRVFGAAARRLASWIERSELREVEGAGHLLQRDRPDAVADAVRSVLGSAAVSPGARR
jgi:pimeloyl-ACP methyl ester carboxylesterase